MPRKVLRLPKIKFRKKQGNNFVIDDRSQPRTRPTLGCLGLSRGSEGLGLSRGSEGLHVFMFINMVSTLINILNNVFVKVFINVFVKVFTAKDWADSGMPWPWS